MRLFVAVPLPEELRRELVRQGERIGRDLPAARWSPASNLHLTLRFLGEIPEPEVDTARSTLRRSVSGRHAFEITLGGRGRFPRRGRPRVLWIGIEPSAPLAELQGRIAADLEAALELEPEGRPFHPHLTLARCRRGWSAGDGERWEEAAAPNRGQVVPVTYVDLMESRLASSGATHRRLERCILES